MTMTPVKVESVLANLAASTTNVQISFVVLAVSGLLVGDSWWLNKNRDEFGSVIRHQMEMERIYRGQCFRMRGWKSQLEVIRARLNCRSIICITTILNVTAYHLDVP